MRRRFDRNGRSAFGPDDDPPRAQLRLGELSFIATRAARLLGSAKAAGPVDGPPCWVLPGFLASDRTTGPLRAALGRAGWRAEGWGLGLNPGAKAALLEALAARLRAAPDKVLLVGWSLGGLYARELARAVPDKVLAVVTLGSPFSGDVRHNTNVRWLYELVARHRVDAPPVARIAATPPVPTLAIWSARDGIVSVRSARGAEGERDAAHELDSTHMGFGLSRRTGDAVARAISDFLARHDLAPRLAPR